MALAIPTDALPVPVPAELSALTDGALSIFEAAGNRNWKSAAKSAEVMELAWKNLSATALPKPVRQLLGEALKSLTGAIEKRSVAKARQAAIETARWSFDLQLRHRPVIEINLARFDLWAAQVLVDAAAKDSGAVNCDMFTLTLIRDRLHGVLDADTIQGFNVALADLISASADEEFDAASKAADKLRDIAARAKPMLW